MFSPCNTDAIWRYEVIARTKSTVTLRDEFGKTKKCRIIEGLSRADGSECVYPLGRYSMAPILSADRQIAVMVRLM